MINIYLIRHGQASFAEQDYDKLSKKGIEQSKILGQHWQKLALAESNANQSRQYYSGSLLRHEQTAEHFFKGMSEGMNEGFDNKKSELKNTPSGLITHAGFNELNHEDILSCYNENWRSFQQMCAGIADSTSVEKSDKNDKKNQQLFKQAFTQAMQRWVSGDFDDEYQESWSQFKQRCLSALADVIAQTNTIALPDEEPAIRKELVIFTSGGVIGVLLGHILQLDDSKMLQISQQLVNSSVSKIISTSDGLRLNYLNNYSHLELAGQEWLSYF